MENPDKFFISMLEYIKIHKRHLKKINVKNLISVVKERKGKVKYNSKKTNIPVNFNDPGMSDIWQRGLQWRY